VNVWNCRVGGGYARPHVARWGRLRSPACGAFRAATLARLCRVQGGYARPDPPRLAGVLLLTVGSILIEVSEKSERRQARQAVAAYHEAQLSELVTHVAVEIDRFRDGELDAFDVDRVLFQYSRAAKELWKYCNLGNVEVTARYVLEAPAIDWWQRGAPKER
jgi:hypothetical protein